MSNHLNERLDCETKYPIVLIHGIFFRDWQRWGCWGRIPEALNQCGARVFFGKQQSASSIARSAQELKGNILDVLELTGSDKVNLIAHSKGGLDSRYMISCLGMSHAVASLTTVNTPHRGCAYAEHLLNTLPSAMLEKLERYYNALFRKLGDKEPDFRGGVGELTVSACRKFNECVPDVYGILYQSVMSTMSSPLSAGFPLGLTWRLVDKYDREPNDGLVAISSAEWGVFLGTVTAPGHRGISHFDIVDFTRRNIRGFDVRAFYIHLVHRLKLHGL